MAMLGFHEQIVSELVEGDGVTVLAAGLGLVKVLAALLRRHAQEKGRELVLLLSTSKAQRQALREEFLGQDDAVTALPMEINNESTSSERMQFYANGGAFFVTSRILIVDMLNERVPLTKVAGVVVNDVHRLSESCAEAFIVRLFRHSNKLGFVRGFSDKPQAMVSGFSKTERIMKSLFVKRLYLWPRFHMSVSHALEETPPEVVDIRMPLTFAMAGIQNAIIEVMDACLEELRRTNKVDVEDLTVENGLFKSFDELIRRQLDPMWHTVGWKTKQLVKDLKTLRKLSKYLLRYDAIMFLKYLDTLRASEGVRSVWIFANPTHKIFELAKRRVYQLIRTDGTPIGQQTHTQTGMDWGKGKRKFFDSRFNQEQPLNNNSDTICSSDYSGSKDAISELSQYAAAQAANKRTRIDESPGMGASVFLKEGELVGGSSDKRGLNPNRADKKLHETVPRVGLEVVVEEMPKWKVLRVHSSPCATVPSGGGDEKFLSVGGWLSES